MGNAAAVVDHEETASIERSLPVKLRRLLLPLAACAALAAGPASANAGVIRIGPIAKAADGVSATVRFANTAQFCAKIHQIGLDRDSYSYDGFVTSWRGSRIAVKKGYCWTTSAGGASAVDGVTWEHLSPGKYYMVVNVWSRRDGLWVKHTARRAFWHR